MKARLGVILWFLAPALLAHDLWLEMAEDGYSLRHGHRASDHAGAEKVPYSPSAAGEAWCADAAGGVTRLPPRTKHPVRYAGQCAAIVVPLAVVVFKSE